MMHPSPAHPISAESTASERLQELGFAFQKVRLAGNALRAGLRFLAREARRGSLPGTLKGIAGGKGIPDMSWAELLEEQARKIPDRTMLLYKDETFTYRQMNENANRVAHLFLELGGGRGKGVGIFMRNSPRFLDVFFGVQKIGMYVVPINCELRGDGLAYIIQHSDIAFLAIDAELLHHLKKLPGPAKGLKKVIVDDVEEEAGGISIDATLQRLSEAYRACASSGDPGVGYDPDDMCLVLYTSGTTGRPKGVIYRYRHSRVKLLGLLADMIIRKDDVYYTAYSLCHANALLLTVTQAMSVGCATALARKFSASGFWEDIRRYDATLFNTIGSIIPILMKQPERPADRRNNVRIVFSSACPVEMWAPFEKRFQVRLYENYSAVDMGTKGIVNWRTAPPGSLGRPLKAFTGKIRVVDSNGREVPPHVPGELLFCAKGGTDRDARIAYFKNERATREKVAGGWVHTGDLVKKDRRGYLYFVGRNTESMRRGGENVSAYEVEQVIRKHDAVEDVAVYAVPSDLAEDEIMCSVKVLPGKAFDARELVRFLSDGLARFAVPRYVRVVDAFPMTSSHRIIKGVLEKEGVTPDTFDARKGCMHGPIPDRPRHP